MTLGSRVASILHLSSIKSLTMFCSGAGICCIQVDDQVQSRIGTPQDFSTAVTYFLRADEYIASLHNFTQGAKDFDIPPIGPFVVASNVYGNA